MNTQISSKLAAFAVALVMNAIIVGGMAHVFTAESQAHTMAKSQNVLAATRVTV